MIDKYMTVIVPTFTDEKCEIDKNGRMTIVEYHNQYRFTLEEALQYVVEHSYDFLLDDIILYNIPLRDLLRAHGMKTFVKEMKDIRPDDVAFADFMDDFAKKKNFHLSDFDIQLYADTDDFTLFGHTFHGLQELQEHMEMFANGGSSNPQIYVRKETMPAPHVGEVYENYPCFDSEDYANETRTYQNYIVRRDPISKAEINRLISIRNGMDYLKVHEQTPIDLLPMVYFKGDGGYILVATEKKMGTLKL